MATRLFSEFNMTLTKRVINIFCRVSVGGAGAVTLQKWSYPTALSSGGTGSYTSAPTTGVGYAVGNAEGVRSVLRNGTGDWTFTFSDPYQRLIQVSANGTAASGLAGAIAVGVNTTTTNTTTNTSTGSGGLVRLTLLSAQNTAADPNSGDKIDFNFTFADSTAS